VVLLHILQFKLTTKYLFLSRQLAELHAAIKYGTIQLGRNQLPSLLQAHVGKTCPGWPTAGKALGGVNFAKLDLCTGHKL